MHTGKRILYGILTVLITAVLAAVPGVTGAVDINGVAAYREFGNVIYLGGLSLNTRRDDPRAIFADQNAKTMEIRFVDSMSDRRWVNGWMQGIAINNSKDTVTGAAEELAAVLSTFRGGMHPGDSVTIHYEPDRGTSVSVNGTELIANRSRSLFNLFLSAWIGPVPPSTQFKQAILGAEGESGLAARFAGISPTVERVNAVQGWVETASAETEPANDDNSAGTSRQLAGITTEPAPSPQSASAEQAAPAAPGTRAPASSVENRQPAQTAEPAATTGGIQSMAQAPDRKAAQETMADQPKLASLGNSGIEAAMIDRADSRRATSLSVRSVMAQQAYVAKVIKRIYQSVRYPDSAIRRNQQGSVRVNLELERSGDIRHLAIAESSSHRALDWEAKRAIKTAAPYPAFTEAMADDILTIPIPISFRLAE